MNSQIIIEIPDQHKNGWENSNLSPILYQTGQFKNQFATKLVSLALNERGVTCFIDEYNNLKFGDNYQSEIKIAFAKFNGFKKEFWFNQIRPNLNNWSHIHFVCVHPDLIEIYQHTKDECLQLCEEASGLSHIGQNELLAINVYQGRQSGTYWMLDVYGNKMASFSTDKITLINNATEQKSNRKRAILYPH